MELIFRIFLSLAKVLEPIYVSQTSLETSVVYGGVGVIDTWHTKRSLGLLFNTD